MGSSSYRKKIAMEKGQRFAVREGGRMIGARGITEIREHDGWRDGSMDTLSNFSTDGFARAGLSKLPNQFRRNVDRVV
jgi:hypothetical protein